jgi:hypothetical protein
MARARWRRRGVLVGVALLLTACHAGGEGAQGPCSLVGADRGIQVVYAQGLHGQAGHVTMKACVRDECRTVVGVVGPQRPLLVMVGRHQVVDATPVPVHVTVMDQNGREAFRGRTQVAAHRIQPNGPGCPPTAWVGRVVATGRHTLR